MPRGDARGASEGGNERGTAHAVAAALVRDGTLRTDDSMSACLYLTTYPHLMHMCG